MTLGPRPRPVIERLLARICIDPESGCWRFSGTKTNSGYGTIGVGSRSDGTKRPALAHRVAYEEMVGPIPVGLHIDHVRERGCVHRDCVNPDHLEAVTPRVNNLRSGAPAATKLRHAAQTHCKQGHAFDSENTYLHPRGTRVCRACSRAAQLRYTQRKGMAA